MADPIGLVKNISEVIKKYNDLELMKQIIDLQQAVFDQQQEILKLSKEITNLKEQLETKDKLKLKQFGAEHFYVFEGKENVPYSQVCYSTKQHLVALPQGENWSGGFRRFCKVCKNFFYEKPMVNTPSPRIRSDYPTGY